MISNSSESARPSRVRWKMLVLLVGFSVSAYVLRVNITIAEHLLMRETGLTPVQLGWIFSSFLSIWWVYYYLVEIRRFSVLSSGILASIPFIVATITTPIAGGISDRLSLRFGRRQGRRIVPIVTLLGAAVLVYFGGIVPGPKAAVVILSLGAALTLAAEGPTWASMSEMSGASAGAATGFLNTGSNLGGFCSTVLTPWIAGALWVAHRLCCGKHLFRGRCGFLVRH